MVIDAVDVYNIYNGIVIEDVEIDLGLFISMENLKEGKFGCSGCMFYSTVEVRD